MRVSCRGLEGWSLQATYHNTGLYKIEATSPEGEMYTWVLSSGLYLRIFAPAVEGQANTLESAQRG